MSFSSKLRKFVPKSLKGIAVGAVVAAAAFAGLSAYRAYASDSYNCDNNAVVYCGASSTSQLASKYNSGDGHNKAYTIQDIYHWFGIGSGDVNDMKSDAVEGSVTSSGNIYAGSTLVATNALTGGREFISGSTTEKYGATTFYTRKPSVSFLQGSLTAMVVMKNGVFQFAILHACGNPVIGTPKKPNYSIQKQVRAAGSNSYTSDVTVKSGTEVQYQITVSSTGAVPVDNVTVRDALPTDITYTSGSLKENGASADASKFFGSGITLSSIKNGDKVVFNFNAVAGKVSATDASCKAETLNNEGYMSATGLPNQSSGAKVTTTCTPPPPQVSLACDQLTLTPGNIDQNTGDQIYTLSAAASVKNATITGYNFTFGDGATNAVTTSATSAKTTHSYAPGTYTASVEVTATANGQTYKETSANCQKSITVTPPAPSTLTCDQLSLTPGNVDSTTGATSYTLAASATAQNATINSYVFTLGDGSANQTVTTGNTSASATHTYAPGTYNVSVSVNGTEKGKTVTVSSANCEGQITVKPPVTVTPTYSCDGLTATPGDVDSTTSNTAYTLAATASADNATITNYVFNFDDNNQTQTVTTGNTSASATHTYAPGTYNPTVTVTVTLSDGTTKQVTSAACATKITVNAPTCTAPNGQTYPKGSAQCTPTCTSPTNGQTYPAGSAQCQPQQTCTAPNGQTYPAGSSQCTPTCTSPTNGQQYPMGSAQCLTPTQLPNTGAGNMIGLFAGVSLAAAGLHWLFVNRRLGRNSL